MAQKYNIDFLRFSAYSMKDLITRKLSEDTKFTDQIYEGSNLAILIDLVSYMYQCFIYLLNNSAAESMFSDTLIYENINRLVRLIGYNPNGIIPSTAVFYIDNNTGNNSGGKFRDYGILKYSGLNTGIIDINGKTIYYSTVETKNINDDLNFELKMVNGRWKYYNNPLIASGTDFETFVLDQIESDIENKKFVGNGYVDVYVETVGGKITQYIKTEDELFSNNNIGDIQNFSNIYDGNTNIYSLRLNEQKKYEIKFGNGIVGKPLKAGDIIHIFYLDTNGYEGKVTFTNYKNDGTLIHNNSYFGISKKLYNNIFKVNDSSKYLDGKVLTEDIKNPNLILLTEYTPAKAEEDVESIRINAPHWFKTGNRLITADDFIFYIKNRYVTEVIDCMCQNNYEYVATFYKWLFDLGISKHDNPEYYLNNAKLVRNKFFFVDPADSNNIYLWIKTYNTELTNNIKKVYKDDLANKKLMTSEINILEPIEVNFAICAATEEYTKVYYLNGSTLFDPNNENYIEITVSDNNIYNVSQIKSLVLDIINKYFDIKNLKLGMTINYNDIYNEILALNGIKNIRTIWVSKDDPNANNPRILNGLSFATWSNSLIDVGDDLNIGNTNMTLHNFQFPRLYTSNLADKIKVIKQSINNINTIQY